MWPKMDDVPASGDKGPFFTFPPFSTENSRSKNRRANQSSGGEGEGEREDLRFCRDPDGRESPPGSRFKKRFESLT